MSVLSLVGFAMSTSLTDKLSELEKNMAAAHQVIYLGYSKRGPGLHRTP